MSLYGDGSARKYASVATSCRLVVLGSERVGKSTFIEQVMKGSFRSDYVPTTLETFIYQMNVDDNNYIVHLCDSSGSKGFARHRGSYLARADGVLLFYSTADKSSLASVVEWATEVKEARQSAGCRPCGVPILLVGTKRDSDRNRAVTIADAEALAPKCLSALSLKMARMSKGEVAKAEAFARLLRGAISSTLPIVEVSALRTNEVLRTLRVMILMIHEFQKKKVVPAPSSLSFSIEHFAAPPCLTSCFTSFDDRSDSAFFRVRSPVKNGGERLDFTLERATPGSVMGPKRNSSVADFGAAAVIRSTGCTSVVHGPMDDIVFDFPTNAGGTERMPSEVGNGGGPRRSSETRSFRTVSGWEADEGGRFPDAHLNGSRF